MFPREKITISHVRKVGLIRLTVPVQLPDGMTKVRGLLATAAMVEGKSPQVGKFIWFTLSYLPAPSVCVPKDVEVSKFWMVNKN